MVPSLSTNKVDTKSTFMVAPRLFIVTWIKKHDSPGIKWE